jgi:hypothetical protein
VTIASPIRERSNRELFTGPTTLSAASPRRLERPCVRPVAAMGRAVASSVCGRSRHARSTAPQPEVRVLSLLPPNDRSQLFVKQLLFEQLIWQETQKTMAKSHLKLVAPTSKNRTVTTPLRRAERRFADQGVSDRHRSRSADRCRQRQSVRPPRRDPDPTGLSPSPKKALT